MTAKEALISVVIAAYNVDRTIQACLDSIVNQTYRNLEIIVIDDCSRDHTVEIASDAAKHDNRILVVERRENSGPAGARNSGLDVAKGKWVAIVDCDDTILPHRLADMLAAAEQNNADIVFDNLFYIEPNIPEGEPVRLYVPSDLDVGGDLTLETYIASHVRSSGIPSLGFLKPLIKRKMMEMHNIRYDRNLVVGEDTMLIVSLMSRGAKAFLMKQPYYQYRRRAGSLSHSQNTNNMRAYDSVFRAFMRDNAAHLKPQELHALNAVLNHNDCRIQARETLDRILKNGDIWAVRNILRNKKTFSLFFREVGSKVKRSRRSYLKAEQRLKENS